MTPDTPLSRLEKANGPSRECILWPRKLDWAGRGRIWVGDKLMLAHRAVWEAVRGPIPEGKMLCHTCDVPACVNPNHLYVGTHADNMRDMAQRGRSFGARDPARHREVARQTGLKNDWARGTRNPKAKLTLDQVAAIQRSVESTKFVAAAYGVNRTTVQRIRNGALWAKR